MVVVGWLLSCLVMAAVHAAQVGGWWFVTACIVFDLFL
jgi:hypothetical protein